MVSASAAPSGAALALAASVGVGADRGGPDSKDRVGKGVREGIEVAVGCGVPVGVEVGIGVGDSVEVAVGADAAAGAAIQRTTVRLGSGNKSPRPSSMQVNPRATTPSANHLGCRALVCFIPRS
jgi:hypothetical protein